MITYLYIYMYIQQLHLVLVLQRGGGTYCTVEAPTVQLGVPTVQLRCSLYSGCLLYSWCAYIQLGTYCTGGGECLRTAGYLLYRWGGVYCIAGSVNYTAGLLTVQLGCRLLSWGCLLYSWGVYCTYSWECQLYSWGAYCSAGVPTVQLGSCLLYSWE